MFPESVTYRRRFSIPVFLRIYPDLFICNDHDVSLIYENINRLLLNNMCMLLGIGLCMVSRLSFDKAIRQYVIVLVSLIFSLLIPYLLGKIHFFKKITWLYATLGIALLGTVLILGEVTHGSKISFSLGGITFQPRNL